MVKSEEKLEKVAKSWKKLGKVVKVAKSWNKWVNVGKIVEK